MHVCAHVDASSLGVARGYLGTGSKDSPGLDNGVVYRDSMGSDEELKRRGGSGCISSDIRILEVIWHRDGMRFKQKKSSI